MLGNLKVTHRALLGSHGSIFQGLEVPAQVRHTHSPTNRFHLGVSTIIFNTFIPFRHYRKLIFTTLDNVDEKVLTTAIDPWLQRLKDSLHSVGGLLCQVDHDSGELVRNKISSLLMDSAQLYIKI
jgi:hypothetical protein